MASKIKLYNDDMFNVLSKIEPQSIDLLLTDFPYGTLNKRNEWDVIIDYEQFLLIISGELIIKNGGQSVLSRKSFRSR